MKVLFLDFDGVLNSHEWARLANDLGINGFDEHDPNACAELKRIVDETGCKIVVSSTWRLLFPVEDLIAVIARAGYPDAPIIGITPDLYKRDAPMGIYMSGIDRRQRGCEIRQWLNTDGFQHGVTRYAIVDDDSDMLPEQAPYFVQTSMTDGLTRAHADRLIEVLNGK